MATIRRAGFGTVFELEDSKVGIGTDAATHTLQALGNIRSEDTTDIGISSLTTYQGFVDKEARFTLGKIDNQSQSGSTSGEIVIDGDVTVSSATTFTSGPQNLTVTDTFTLPLGDTNSRETKPTIGSLRFNQHFATLEFYTGNNWATVNTFTDIKTNPQGRGRAVWAGGYDNSGKPANTTSSIDFINVPTLGNSINFGDLSSAGQDAHGCGSETRGLYMGFFNGNAIEYITIASEGDSIDFGDLFTGRYFGAAGSSSTRGMYFGGDEPTTINNIDYVQINTLGNSIDFGDLTVVRMTNGGSLSNGRVIYNGGGDTFPTGGATSTYDKNIIASLGNSVDFGNLIEKVAYGPGGNSNTVRGVLCGGQSTSDAPYYTTRIQYITMSSGGDAQYFGDLSTRSLPSGAGVTQTRAVFALGLTQPANNDVNTLEFITIATTGNSQDFGDLRGGTNRAHSRVISPVSDSHGGLGGF